MQHRSQILSALEAGLPEVHNSGSFGWPKELSLVKTTSGGKGSGMTSSWVWKEVQIFAAAFFKMDFFPPSYTDILHRSRRGWRSGVGKQKICPPALLDTLLGALLVKLLVDMGIWQAN